MDAYFIDSYFTFLVVRAQIITMHGFLRWFPDIQVNLINLSKFKISLVSIKPPFVIK